MNRYNSFLYLIFILFFLIKTGNAQHLIINEILTSNSKINTDGFGEYDDWVELCNTSDSTIQLAGMFITDDPEYPTKHQIGLTTSYWTAVEPDKYILLWTDNDPEQGQRHISFSLNKKGGYLGIYDKDTNLIDEIKYRKQKENTSLGRLEVKSDEWVIYKTPSPSKPNIGGIRLNDEAISVDVNLPSGFYKVPQSIELSCSTAGNIYYTIDGSEPSINSTLYTEPIKIDSNTILRARLIQKGFMPNSISNRSYFINESSTLSVISLIIDPKDLWRKRKGIYANYQRRGMEVPAYVEYFDTTSLGEFKLGFRKSAKTRIAGKTSRRQPKKSFAFFATNDDNEGERFEYPVFDDKDISSFGGLWVRADATSGRNVSDLWVGERFKNELIYEINNQMKGNLDMQAYEPVSVFLNGKYWGLYNLMERKGKDFIFNNHKEKDVDVLTAEDAKVVSGNISEYDQMISYIAQNDITTDSVYNEICKLIEIDSYIDYWVNETYSGARDINVNIRFWKSEAPNSKWKWISYDQDSWYTSQEKSLKYYLGKGKVFLLGRLMKNSTFRIKWINRMCDYLNSGFKGENIISLVDSITSRIETEVIRDKERWADTMLYIPKGQRVRWIKLYAYERPVFLRQNMLDYFDLPGKVSKITINQPHPEQGTVKLNTIYPIGSSWSGLYLSDVPITIEAIPNLGYRFVKWKKRRLPQNSKITVSTKKQRKFEPVFEKINGIVDRY